MSGRQGYVYSSTYTSPPGGVESRNVWVGGVKLVTEAVEVISKPDSPFERKRIRLEGLW